MDLLHHLTIFQRVAESGGFSRAAEQLGMAPSSVSAAIRALESHLGTQLFQRTTRQVRLSSDGERLLARSRELLAGVHEVRQLFRAREAVAGHLRVDMPARIASRLVAPALPGFLAAYPAASFDLVGSDRYSDVVGDGIDCVLRVGDPGNPNLAARPLGRLPQATCAAPALLARHDLPQRLEDLAALPAIHYGRHPAGSDECFEFEAGGRRQTQTLRGRLSVVDAETYIACAIAGLGLIQVPRFDVADALADGRLVEVLPQSPPPSLALTALYPPQQRRSRLLHAFIDWLELLVAPLVQR